MEMLILSSLIKLDKGKITRAELVDNIIRRHKLEIRDVKLTMEEENSSNLLIGIAIGLISGSFISSICLLLI